ncbi:MAG: M20 family metallopeptidase [Lachnospiraceae bacterium]
MLDTYCNFEFCKKTLQKFIKINTCQPAGNESLMVSAILELFPTNTLHTIINHGNNRQTLIIKIPGKQDCGGIAFIGHTDTVPYGDCISWKYPPLSGTEKNGFIFGRGAVDMKSGDTSMTAAALSLLKLNEKPRENIYFCFSADEENRGLGAIALSELDYLNTVNEFFIAEPSNEMIGIAEKGALWLNIKSTGVLAHSSRPHKGINAIEKSIEFKKRLEYYIDTNTQDKYLGQTTISITNLKGGVSNNVIPDSSEMTLDIRTLTNINHQLVIQYASELVELMENEEPGLHIDVSVLNNRPAVSTEENHPFVHRVEKIYKDLGINSSKKGLFFYTDASQLIPKNNKPFLIIGPGNDEMAHQTDECVSIDSIVRMSQFYLKYLINYYYLEEEL